MVSVYLASCDIVVATEWGWCTTTPKIAILLIGSQNPDFEWRWRAGGDLPARKSAPIIDVRSRCVREAIEHVWFMPLGGPLTLNPTES